MLDYTGIQRGPLVDSFDQYDLVITTYGTMQRDIVKLKDIRFDYAILDESQAIKNAQSQRAKASRLLKADHRLAMTGTPVENHLGELWSLLEFLNPGMLGTRQGVPEHLASRSRRTTKGWRCCAGRWGPFILRRTKQQVLTELPPKTEQTLHCDLEGKQRKRYDELRTYYRAVLAERIAKNGHEAVEDPRPGGAAPPAAGGHSSGPDRQGLRRRIQRQARRAHGAASRGDRRRAQGPGLLAVHFLPGDRPQPARPREAGLRVPRRPHAAAAGARRAIPERSRSARSSSSASRRAGTA